MSEDQPHLVDIHIGARIRMARRDLAFSQEHLAEICGVTFQQVQKYERGANRVSGSRLWMISRALKVPISYFYDGLPQEPAQENPLERRLREYAMTDAGRGLLAVGLVLPPEVVSAFIEAMATTEEAVRRARSHEDVKLVLA